MPEKDTKFLCRLSQYSAVSAELKLFSDDYLLNLLNTASPIDKGFDGASFSLEIGSAPVFIKKIRLTEREMIPTNRMSTKNFYELPLYYQYGVGSAGFGAWRELFIHTMTTNWVLENECKNFPLMYHWRLLPGKKITPSDQDIDQLERELDYWEGSPAIYSRLFDRLEFSTDLVLFLEYFPENLHSWLSKKLAENAAIAEQACIMVENNLNDIFSFISSKGLLHFDAHFDNILTDGNRLYFCDFGLALSSQFDLSILEIDFFKSHKKYDYFSTKMHLLHCIITNLFGKDNWVQTLADCANGKRALTPTIDSIIKRYAPIAFVMDQFYRDLQVKSKTTPYPYAELNQIYEKFK